MLSTEVRAAIDHGDVGTVERWAAKKVDEGATVDTDVDRHFGATALQWACQAGHPGIVTALLRRNANANHRNVYKATPLHWALQHAAPVAVVSALLQNGATPTARNVHGDSPLDVGEEHKADPDVMNLLKGGAAAKPPTGVADKSPKKANTPPGRPSRPSKPSSRGSPPKPTDAPPKAVRTTRTTTTEVRTTDKSDTSSVGYTSGRHPQDETADVQQMQRARVKAEVESKQATHLIERLRNEVSQLQRDKLDLVAQAETVPQLQKRIDALQRERMELQLALKQAAVDEETRRREKSVEERTDRDKQAAEHEVKVNLLMQEKRMLENEKRRTQDDRDRLAHDGATRVGQKEAELEELKGTIAKLQSENIRLEVGLNGLEDMRDTITDLQKEKALLQLEAAQVGELQDSLEEMQDARLKSDARRREMEREREETVAANTQLRKHVKDLEEELQSMRMVKETLVRVEREKNRALLQVQSLQDDLERRREGQQMARDAREAAVEEMHAAMATLNREKLQLQHRLNEAEAEADRLRGSSGASTEEVEALKAELHDMLQRFPVAQATIGALEKERVALKGEVDAARRDAQAERTKAHDALKDRAEMDADLLELEDMRRRMREAEKSRGVAEVSVREKELVIEELRALVDGVHAEKSLLEEQNRALHDLRDAHRKLQGEHRDTVDDLHRLQLDSAAQLEARQAVANQRVEEAERVRDAAEGKLQAAEREVVRLETEHLLAQRSAAELEHRQAALVDRAEVSAMQARLDIMKQEVADAVEARKTSDQIAADLRSKVDVLSVERNAIQTMLNTRERELQSKESGNSMRDRDAKELNNLLTSLKIQLQEAEGRTVELQHEVTHQQQLHESELLRLHDQHRVETETSRREMLQQQRQLQHHSDTLKQRLKLMEAERHGMEMQIHALQQHAALGLDYSGPTPMKRPRSGGTPRKGPRAACDCGATHPHTHHPAEPADLQTAGPKAPHPPAAPADKGRLATLHDPPPLADSGTAETLPEERWTSEHTAAVPATHAAANRWPPTPPDSRQSSHRSAPRTPTPPDVLGGSTKGPLPPVRGGKAMVHGHPTRYTPRSTPVTVGRRY